MYRQALVITHEGATREERAPYLTLALHPLPVIEMFGRSATQEPRCKKEEALFYGWQDRMSRAYYVL